MSNPFAGIGDAIEQHPLGADARDPDLPVGIELAAPLDGVRQQLAERLCHRFAHRLRQIRFELHDERLDASAISSEQGAMISSHSGLADTTSIDSAAAVAFAMASLTTVDDGVGRERLAEVPVRLSPDRLEQRFRRVVGRHHDHEWRGRRARARGRGPRVRSCSVDRCPAARCRRRRGGAARWPPGHPRPISTTWPAAFSSVDSTCRKSAVVVDQQDAAAGRVGRCSHGQLSLTAKRFYGTRPT